MPSKLNILLSAYSLAPEQGSEPAQGWNTAKGLAKNNRVFALVAYHYQRFLPKHLDSENKLANQLELTPNFRVRLVRVPFLWRFYENRGGAFRTFYYYIWQFFALMEARTWRQNLLKDEKQDFDVVHHVTFGKITVPSLLFLFKKPLIFGPAGGGEKTPRAYFAEFSTKEKFIEYARETAQTLAKFDPLLRSCFQKAYRIFATTTSSKKMLNELAGTAAKQKIELLTQVGLWRKEILDLGKKDEKETGESNRYFLVAGRLLYWKNVSGAIEAFAETLKNSALQEKELKLLILGDGAQKGKLYELCKRLRIADKVVFKGHLPRAESIKLMQSDNAIAFLHPSLHDSGGFVIVEAMSCGLPVICLDKAGPQAILAGEKQDKFGGYIIKSADKSIGAINTEIAKAMQILASDQNKRKELGAIAKKDALARLSWERKIETYEHYYKKAVSKR